MNRNDDATLKSYREALTVYPLKDKGIHTDAHEDELYEGIRDPKWVANKEQLKARQEKWLAPNSMMSKCATLFKRDAARYKKLDGALDDNTGNPKPINAINDFNKDDHFFVIAAAYAWIPFHSKMKELIALCKELKSKGLKIIYVYLPMSDAHDKQFKVLGNVEWNKG